MLALARKIVNGDEDEAETVESVFAQARDAEATAEEYLVDDGWDLVQVEPEPAAVEMDGNHDCIGIGPTVDPVLANGHDVAKERPQSLFSWTEFLAERAGRQAQPEAQARFHVPLRVGAQHGGREGRAGRRGTPGRMRYGRGRRTWSGGLPANAATQRDSNRSEGDEPWHEYSSTTTASFPTRTPR